MPKKSDVEAVKEELPRITLTGERGGSARKCVECGAWTERFAESGDVEVPLCDEHRDTDTAAKHLA